jgi:hypothetical protein
MTRQWGHEERPEKRLSSLVEENRILVSLIEVEKEDERKMQRIRWRQKGREERLVEIGREKESEKHGDKKRE